MKKDPIIKPRNKVIKEALFRKAGPHTKTNKAKRKKQKQLDSKNLSKEIE